MRHTAYTFQIESQQKELSMKSQFRTRKCKITLLGLLFIFVCFNVHATIYYVSNSGNDDNTGTGRQTAWKTISKVNSMSFQPGDSILFEKGGIWRSTLYPIAEGTSENYIVFSNYGEGDNPRILASNVSSSWEPSGTANVWQSDDSFSNPHRPQGQYSNIWFESNNSDTTTWGVYHEYSTGFGSLKEEFDWCFNDNRVYVYSESDPDTRYHSIELSQRNNSIELNNQDYIEINGIDCHYGALSGIRDSYPTSERYGLIVRNCNIGYIGVKNDPAAFGVYTWRSNLLVEKNIIHDCGRRGISYFGTNVGGSVRVHNAIIQDNLFYNGWHTTSLDLIVMSGSDHSIDSVIFRRNIVEEDPDIPRNGGSVPHSNHMFIADQSGSGSGTVSNIFIYNNVFVYAPGSAIKTEYIVNLQIYNNTFYGFNTHVSNFQSLIQLKGSPEANTSTVIKNNILYHNGIFKENNNLMGIKINPEIRNDTEIDYNIYYTKDPTARFFTSYPPMTAYNISMWEDYRSEYGYDKNSPTPQLPGFVNAPNDFRLASGSGCISAGTPIDMVTNDILGNPRDPHNPSLGAYKYKDSNNIHNIKSSQVRNFMLIQNNSNPFNPEIVISYNLTESSDVTLRVYDVLCRLVNTLVNKKQSSGNHKISWNGRDSAGKQLANGIYVYRFHAGTFNQAMKMIFLK